MKISYKHEIKNTDKITPEDILKLILKHRHIKNIKDFLNPQSPLKIELSDFGSSGSRHGQQIKKVLKLLQEIKEKKQMIVVYTDYDADGITGGAILWETLYLLGFKTMPYVPHRKNEGYGFSQIGINNVIKLYDPALIISVDHGITAKEKIKYANSLGIKVIVTDHHLKPDHKLEVKDAEAIFYVPQLAGAGVAYFFAKMIFNHFQSPIANHQQLATNFQTDYLALASIGTVADLVPLIGPSRSFVKYGLETFLKTKRVGLKEIIKDAGIEERKITPYEIGFMIAPRINAVGRLEHAIDALRLLCTRDAKKARQLATNIGAKNRQRQDLVEKAVEEAKNQILKKPVSQLPKLIILVSDHWHEGIIGLIASKIADEFYRPTIIITKTDGVYKGSARSISALHMINFLRDLKKYLIDVGGHRGAAGFTIEEKNITTFTTTAIKVANKIIKNKDLEKKIAADIKIPLSKVTLSKVTLRVTKELEKLQPFGIGNPQPTFYSRAEIIGATIFGKTNSHLKIFIKDPYSNSPPLEMIAFSAADKYTQLSRGKIIDLIYNLEVNRWGGSEKLRGKIIFIELISADLY